MRLILLIDVDDEVMLLRLNYNVIRVYYVIEVKRSEKMDMRSGRPP